MAELLTSMPGSYEEEEGAGFYTCLPGQTPNALRTPH
jgi:hypothetical protein